MEQKTGFWQSLYQSMASLKLTVVIFLTLAIASLVGTLLPQKLTESELENQYGPAMARIIEFLGLNDLYHTGWFRFLLLLLCLNLIICTIERLPKTLKRLRHREDQINPQKLVKFGCNSEIVTRLPFEEARSRLTQVITQEFGAPQPLENSDPGVYGAIAEKGRWSPLMVYVVHLSVLVVLLGALIGSIFGFKGMMTIPEGETAGEVMLMSGHETIPLPFQVRCDMFEVSYYDTGVPKEFRSDLVILEDGKEVLKESIRVNDPLTYKGITFYQSNYGTTLKRADLELVNTDTGKSYSLTLVLGEPVTIPGTKDQVEIVNYRQDVSRFGPALGVTVIKEGQAQPSGSWILVNVPEFHGNRVQNYQVRVKNTEQVEYTGLQVKQDPGVWTVWIGFLAMLIGTGLTFYTSHRKLWIWASPAPQGRTGSRVIIAGRASKNSLAFEHEFNQLFERLQNALKLEKGKAGHDDQ
jgi:cytochrome c biogenesis protein